LFAATAQKGTTAEQQSCGKFVQSFYDWYVPTAAQTHKGAASDIALHTKASYFAPELAAQMKASYVVEDTRTGYIVGLDFDPFLSGQDPGDPYTTGKIKVANHHCVVDMLAIYEGRKDKTALVAPELEFRKGRWLFINFHYPFVAPKSDLVTLLNSLAADQVKSKPR
jgi:hypothetical protein